MALLYQGFLGSYYAAFLLVVLLLPGVVFMVFGLERWRNDRGSWRWPHLVYLLLFSLLIEWFGVLIAYWFIFEVQFEQLPKVLVNPVFLWIFMLFFSFLHDRLFGMRGKTLIVSEEPQWFEITSDRKKVQIDLNKLLFIESRNEQCFLHLEDEELPTRERISQLAERLPEEFLRIHRSYIINPVKAQGIQKTEVQIAGRDLPVSRSYKPAVEEFLNQV